MTLIRKFYSTGALLILITGFSFGVQAAEEAGNVIRASGEVSVKNGSGNPRTLANGDAVHVGDTIKTGVNASAQLQMRDGAIIALAAESEFRIQSYNYQPGNVLFISDEASTKSAVSLLLQKGRLRTITGSTPKNAYGLRTPSALVHIDGTVFDVLVTYKSTGGATSTIILREGGISVQAICNDVLTGKIQVLDVPGMATTVEGCRAADPEPTDENVDDLDDLIDDDDNDGEETCPGGVCIDDEDDEPNSSP